MEPPPAPIVWMSVTANESGRSLILVPLAISAFPPLISDISALVPPISIVMISSILHKCPRFAAPLVPAAGPDKAMCAPDLAAS